MSIINSINFFIFLFIFIGVSQQAPTPSKNNAEQEEDAIEHISDEDIANPVEDVNVNVQQEEPTEHIPDEDMARLVEDVNEYARGLGLVTKKVARAATLNDERSQEVEGKPAVAPYSIFPSAFPRKYFQQAVDIQQALQMLQFRISNDYEWLIKIHEPMMKSNGVVRNMVNILSDVLKEGMHQPLTVMMQRSDYMLHTVNVPGSDKPKYELKQIEINVGPTGGAPFASRLTKLHRYVIEKAGMDASEAVMPDNRAATTLAEGLFLAWKKFGDPNAIMLFVDHHSIRGRSADYEVEAMAMKEGFKIGMKRLSMKSCTSRLRLGKGGDFSLYLSTKGKKEKVAVVHFGELLNKYWGAQRWATRRDIERSTAIQSPSIAGSLSASKKVQQMLAQPGAVERFFPKPEEQDTVTAIRATYAGLWGLDKTDEETESVIKDAMEHPENYVLKPEGDGGGNNFFGEDIPKKLSSFSADQRSAHILMQRLRPMVVKNYMVHPLQKAKFGKVVSELGVYGCLVGDRKEGTVLHNVQQGHYLKTSWSHVDEGGITMGHGVRDTPYLY